MGIAFIFEFTSTVNLKVYAVRCQYAIPMAMTHGSGVDTVTLLRRLLDTHEAAYPGADTNSSPSVYTPYPIRYFLKGSTPFLTPLRGKSCCPERRSHQRSGWSGRSCCSLFSLEKSCFERRSHRLTTVWRSSLRRLRPLRRPSPRLGDRLGDREGVTSSTRAPSSRSVPARGFCIRGARQGSTAGQCTA